ncbi:MAG: LamG-like jellyroll fold domain-containing protein [Planctomycetota bacterium]|nr:LamG-like jellyroll fold domain-containing protein [Planctomycetota bacterium]
MRAISLLAVTLWLTGTVTSQDVIYYPFLTGSGTTVTNLGSGPATGTLATTNTTNSGWTTGKFDNALAGVDAAGTGSWVNTGYTAAVTGSFTVAFFMKESFPVANTLSYQISGRGSFRMFTGGVAYEALYLRAWGGAPADLILRGPSNQIGGQPYINLRAKAAMGWVHIALVVDATAMVATYYVDGSPFSTTPITAPANILAGSAFMVGMHTSAGLRSNQHLDDFRFSTNAVPPHQIQAWASAKLVATTTEVSIAATGAQGLQIDAGNTAVNQYWIFASVTGTWPELPLSGVSIPLVPDVFTTLAMDFVNTPVFQNYRSVMANGTGRATFQLPANTPAASIGVTIYQAALIYAFNGNILDVTNAIPTKIVQ